MKTKVEVSTITLDNKPVTSAELRAHARVLFQRIGLRQTDRAELEYQLANAAADRAEAYDRAYDDLINAAGQLLTARRKEHAARMRHADHGSERTYTTVHSASERVEALTAIVHNAAIDLALAAGRDSRYDSMHPLHRYPDAWRASARRAREANEDRINHASMLDTDSTPSHLAAIADAEAQPAELAPLESIYLRVLEDTNDRGRAWIATYSAACERIADEANAYIATIAAGHYIKEKYRSIFDAACNTVDHAAMIETRAAWNEKHTESNGLRLRAAIAGASNPSIPE